MNNLLSYCGLVDARISDSDKDLPVTLLNSWAKKISLEKMFPNIEFYLILLVNRFSHNAAEKPKKSEYRKVLKQQEVRSQSMNPIRR